LLPLLTLEYVGVIEDNSIILPNVINRNVGTTFQYFLAPLFSDDISLKQQSMPWWYSARQKSVSKTSPGLAEQFECDDSSI